MDAHDDFMVIYFRFIALYRCVLQAEGSDTSKDPTAIDLKVLQVIGPSGLGMIGIMQVVHPFFKELYAIFVHKLEYHLLNIHVKFICSLIQVKRHSPSRSSQWLKIRFSVGFS